MIQLVEAEDFLNVEPQSSRTKEVGRTVGRAPSIPSLFINCRTKLQRSTEGEKQGSESSLRELFSNLNPLCNYRPKYAHVTL